MPNDEFREAHEERREHGLKARHETREARAVRKAVAEEIAERFLADARQHEEDRDGYLIAQHYARIAREIGSRDPA